MKKILLATTALVALSLPAAAADMRMPVKAAPMMASGYNWAGPYVGGNIGYGWGDNTGGQYSGFTDFLGGLGAFFTAGGNVLPSVSPSGVLGGVQIGYNWMLSPSFVAGVVADIQAADISDTGARNVSIGGFANITQSKSVSTDWFGTVRGKLGFAANNVLFYGTAGVAYGRVKASTSFNDPSFGGGPVVFAGSNSETNTGFTFGAGIDWGLTQNWVIGAEYLHVDLGDITVREARVSGPANATTFTSNSKVRNDIGRLTINYKF